jgi:uncharacterized protein (DUF433 family)
MSILINNLLEPKANRKGRLCVAGTGTTVHRIAVWYKTGWSAEEISRRYAHLPIAGVYAALAYYHANQAEIESEIITDQTEELRLESEWMAISREKEEVAA